MSLRSSPSPLRVLVVAVAVAGLSAVATGPRLVGAQAGADVPYPAMSAERAWAFVQAAEGRLSREEFVQQHSQAINVAAVIEPLRRRDLLGAHVRRRPHDAPRLGQLLGADLHHSGQPKVRDLGPARAFL